MSLISWIMIATWILLGIFAYGMGKGIRRNCCRQFGDTYGWRDEILLWILIPLGLLGFLYIYDARSCVSFSGDKIFCFRMPKEFRKRRAS